MKLIPIIFVLLVFIFIYVKMNPRKNTVESFNNDKITSLSNILSENIKKESETTNYQKIILRLITQNIDNFEISKKQYHKMLSDLEIFFRNSSSQFQKKMEEKVFVLSISINKIVSLSNPTILEIYAFIYLFINQDLLSKKQLYVNYENQFGPFLYFLSKKDFINSQDTIYQRIPYSYQKILNLKDIIYLYESLRVEKVIPFSSLLDLKKYSQKYIKKKNIYIKNRESYSTLSPDDDNYIFYSKNLENISELPKDLEYFGVPQDNNNIDISKKPVKNLRPQLNKRQELLNYHDPEILPLDYDYQHKYNNRHPSKQILNNKNLDPLKSNRDFIKDNMKFLNTNIKQINKPLKWGCQRQWEETEGPNFLDPNYIYPARN